MKWYKQLNKENNENGEIMIESLIVFGITMLLLFFMLAIYSVMYQNWNMQTIANEAVARVAQTYRFSKIDESSGYVTEKDFVDVGPYRYVTNTLFKTMDKEVDERLDRYCQRRLSNTTYAKNVNKPECTVAVKPDAMGRRHIELTLKCEYAVPFGEVLDYFGFGGTTEYEVTAYADCVDLVDYINFVDFVDTQTSLKQFGSKTIGLIDSVLNLFDNIFSKDS